MKQTGVTCYIFPGASHHRFEHSIGVSILANKLISSIKQRQPELGVSERDVRCVTLAGLCHDLGHGPFSHAFEDWLRRRHIDFHHEDMSLRMMDLLIDENSIEIEEDDVKLIKSLIVGQPISGRNAHLEDAAWLYDIVNNKRNSIDVDKWDYLARDCYNLGMKRSYDFSRLMMNSRVIGDEICFHAKEAYNIYEMFHTRYSLFKQVYSHRVGKAIEYMIGDAFDLADEHLGISQSLKDPRDYCTLTDCLLRQIEISKDPNLVPSQKIIQRLRRRDLYKMAEEVILNPGSSDLEITPQLIVNHSFAFSDEEHFIDTQSVLLDSFTCNYAMKDKNPVDGVHFFSKWDDTSSFPIEKEKVSLLIPNTFSERYLRIYCKQSHQVSVAQKSFRAALQSLGKDSPSPGPAHFIPHKLMRTKTPPYFSSVYHKRERNNSSLSDESYPSKKPKNSD